MGLLTSSLWCEQALFLHKELVEQQEDAQSLQGCGTVAGETTGASAWRLSGGWNGSLEGSATDRDRLNEALATLPVILGKGRCRMDRVMERDESSRE